MLPKSLRIYLEKGLKIVQKYLENHCRIRFFAIFPKFLYLQLKISWILQNELEQSEDVSMPPTSLLSLLSVQMAIVAAAVGNSTSPTSVDPSPLLLSIIFLFLLFRVVFNALLLSTSSELKIMEKLKNLV